MFLIDNLRDFLNVIIRKVRYSPVLIYLDTKSGYTLFPKTLVAINRRPKLGSCFNQFSTALFTLKTY